MKTMKIQSALLCINIKFIIDFLDFVVKNDEKPIKSIITLIPLRKSLIFMIIVLRQESKMPGTKISTVG